MDVRAAIETFVEVYNREGSLVYPLYADELDWLEMPSGRRGGRAELFAALKEARDMVEGMKLKPLSIVADTADGFLETEWSGRRRSDGSAMFSRVLWVFAFKDGKITKEHDYSIRPASPPAS
jgi:ketosteroid isomerase-like protein